MSANETVTIATAGWDRGSVWRATNQLRFLIEDRVKPASLQQMWQSDSGKVEWRNVPYVVEQPPT